MAVKDFFDNLNGGARWDVGVSINRSNSLPLDANSVFASLEAAQNYAAGNPAEGTLANAYPGQVLAVVTDAETIIYYIDANMTLQPVGNTKDVMAYIGEIPETSDAKTIIEYINSKTEGIATVDSLAQLQKDVQALATTVNGKAASGEEGEEGYEPAVVGLVDEVAAIKETIGVEASEGVEATGLEKKIADEITARVAGDKANSDVIEMLALAINGREASEGVEAVTGLTDRVATNEQGISDINDKIGTVTEGKTVIEMISDVEGKIPTNVSAFTNDAKYQTDTEVLATINAKIAEINHAVFQKVDTVPAVADAEANVLYLVPSGDKMDIYAKIGEEMVLIDDTDTDLSGYALKSELHEHANKELLDTYDQTNADIKDAVGKKHSHSFVDTDVEDAIAKKHEHKNFDLLETYTQTEADLKDAVEKKHSHTNGTVLDAITAEKVAAWDEAEKNVIASVDEAQFAIDTDRKLTLLDVNQSKITGLKNASDADITLAEALANKVEKNGTDRLITEDEADKLAGLTYDENGKVTVSGTVDAGNVGGLDTLLEGKVDKVEGMGLSANDFTDTLLEKLNGIAAGAQVNVIEGIKFNGTTVTVGEDKIADITYTLPIADADTLGGVKSVEAIIGDDGKITNAKEIENKVSVANDGTMSVNSLNVNKLVQDEETVLILDGGSAND